MDRIPLRLVVLAAAGVIGWRAAQPWLEKLKSKLATYLVRKAIDDIVSKHGHRCEIGSKCDENEEELKCFVNAPKNLKELFKSGNKFEEQEFLVHRNTENKTEARLTFRAALSKAAALEAALVEACHVVPGDRVAILMSNILEFPISFIAVASIGAISVSLNAFWEGELIRYGIEDSQASVVILDEKRLERLVKVNALQALQNSRIKFILVRESQETPLPSGVLDFQRLVESEYPSYKSNADPAPEDVACIMYTSGTTSVYPKGVCLTHQSFCQATVSYALFLDVVASFQGTTTVQRVDLITSPLFHAAAFSSAFLLAFFNGNKLVFLSRWSSDGAIDAFIHEEVTFVGLMPTMLNDLLFNPRFKAEASKFRLTNIGTGGASCPSELIRRLHETLPHVGQGGGWGLTESNALGTFIGGPEFREHVLSCGRAHKIVELKVVDPETGKDIENSGVEGELCIRSICNMKEYWNKPLETEQSFYPGRWLRTGDVGKIDNDGYVYITDRLKDIVIRGGENISSTLVEDVILRMDSDLVVEAAVFGLPHKRLGEQLCAAVAVKHQNGQRLSGQDIRSFIENHLSAHMIPSHIFLRDATKKPLPRGPTGKILKKSLREEYIEFIDDSL